jgi:hypothetical protein
LLHRWFRRLRLVEGRRLEASRHAAKRNTVRRKTPLRDERDNEHERVVRSHSVPAPHRITRGACGRNSFSEKNNEEKNDELKMTGEPTPLSSRA